MRGFSMFERLVFFHDEHIFMGGMEKGDDDLVVIIVV